MKMNPGYYYDNFVKPNYDEFCADKGNLRKAFNAVISLCHMVDNYFFYYKRKSDSRVTHFNKIRDFKKYLGRKNKYFNDVQSVANAYKHLYTYSTKAYVSVASGGDFYLEETKKDDQDIIDTDDLQNAPNSFCTIYFGGLLLEKILQEAIKEWGNILQI